MTFHYRYRKQIIIISIISIIVISTIGFFVYKNLNQKELIFALYHEIGHAIYNSKEYLNLGKYDDFIYALDYEYCQLQEGKYMTNGVYHDSLSYEILADKYAIKTTREFFQKNPKYKCDEKWLNEKEKSILDRYEQYDASSRIDKFIELGNSNPDCPFSDWPFWLFLNNDGSFKDIAQPINSDFRKYIQDNILESFNEQN